MMSSRTVLVLAAVIAVSWPAAVAGQDKSPQVEIVQTVGCVEQRGGDAPTWWLTRSVEPTVIAAGVFDETQVEEAKGSTLGTRSFQLIGVADFLDAESLLGFGDRAQFTTRDQVNATGELVAGRTVLVKGLLIETNEPARINLLVVVTLSDGCA
jgi:hypothetical protein